MQKEKKNKKKKKRNEEHEGKGKKKKKERKKQQSANSLPQFDQVVAASRNKAFDVVRFLGRGLVDQTSRKHGRSPADSVAANLQRTMEKWREKVSQTSH